jgi:hypothetical protein
MGRRGEFVGRTLIIDRAAQENLRIQLPAESFVGRRQGHAVVYTRADSGQGSEVHLVDLATGCDTLIARPSGVARSAILARDGSAVYIHTVTQGSRADAGVARHDLATGVGTIVVPALAPSAQVGRIFGTQLAWNLSGDSLIVQSCGFSQCASRILDSPSGTLHTVEYAGQGALIGATDDTLVTYAACPGLPCAVIAHDLTSGQRRLLSDEAYEASLLLVQDGSSIVSMTTADGTIEVAP